jgi:hypothetical protein
MKIKIDATEITIPEFIVSELGHGENQKLFDNFLHTVLEAQKQRIRDTLMAEHDKDKRQWDMFEQLFRTLRDRHDC